jgi:thioredoxin 1
MATVTVTEQSFEGLVKNGIVFLDFWASWCGPCRAFAPVYEKVADQHPDVVWGKVNTEEEQRLAQTFGIRAIPTLMIFREGVLLFSNPGVVPAEALEDLLKQVQALDMDEVRRDIATRAKEPEGEESGGEGVE